MSLQGPMEAGPFVVVIMFGGGAQGGGAGGQIISVDVAGDSC